MRRARQLLLIILIHHLNLRPIQNLNRLAKGAQRGRRSCKYSISAKANAIKSYPISTTGSACCVSSSVSEERPQLVIFLVGLIFRYAQRSYIGNNDQSANAPFFSSVCLILRVRRKMQRHLHQVCASLAVQNSRRRAQAHFLRFRRVSSFPVRYTNVQQVFPKPARYFWFQLLFRLPSSCDGFWCDQQLMTQKVCSCIT